MYHVLLFQNLRRGSHATDAFGKATRSRHLLIAVCLVFLAVGCGSAYDARVSGTVTLDGLALERGIVAFHPSGSGPTAHGVIDADGRYDLMVGRERGLASGEYDVTVVSTEARDAAKQGGGPPPPGRRLTTELISNRSTTYLHYSVSPGSNHIDLELESQDPVE